MEFKKLKIKGVFTLPTNKSKTNTYLILSMLVIVYKAFYIWRAKVNGYNK